MKIINRIILFFSLLCGFGITKTKSKQEEPESIVTISQEQQQDELHRFLMEECIVYDPNSKEAKAELVIMNSMIGDIGGSFYEVEDDKMRNRLIGKPEVEYGS